MIEPRSNRQLHEVRETAKVLQADVPVYLRYQVDNQEHTELLRCLRFDLADLAVELEWFAQPGEFSVPVPPAVGEAVQCFTSENGYLCSTTGVLLRIDESPAPVLKIQLGNSMSAYRIRQYERYPVWGRLCLGESGEGDYFYHNEEPLPLNVSFGGFGLRLIPQGWRIGDRIRFALEACQPASCDEHVDKPVLRLRGNAVLRSQQELDDDKDRRHLGFEFDSLPEYQLRALRLWLATTHVYHRL
ncbi:PilZ domain-containing protein [bacterium]|nr:PilZ domain-containing protein [bacterium]